MARPARAGVSGPLGWSEHREGLVVDARAPIGREVHADADVGLPGAEIGEVIVDQQRRRERPGVGEGRLDRARALDVRRDDAADRLNRPVLVDVIVDRQRRDDGPGGARAGQRDLRAEAVAQTNREKGICAKRSENIAAQTRDIRERREGALVIGGALAGRHDRAGQLEANLERLEGVHHRRRRRRLDGRQIGRESRQAHGAQECSGKCATNYSLHGIPLGTIG